MGNIRNQILGSLRIAGVTPAQFAKLCGESTATFYRHLQNPDKLTYGELRRLEKYVGMHLLRTSLE